MLKQVTVMKRRPGLSMDEFIQLYENHHAKFGETLFAKARRFVRRYVQPMTNPLTGDVAETDFDVIMEIWWDSAEDQQAALASIATSGLIDQIRESGARLFASQNNPAFMVTEYESELANPVSRL